MRHIIIKQDELDSRLLRVVSAVDGCSKEQVIGVFFRCCVQVEGLGDGCNHVVLIQSPHMLAAEPGLSGSLRVDIKSLLQIGDVEVTDFTDSEAITSAFNLLTGAVELEEEAPPVIDEPVVEEEEEEEPVVPKNYGARMRVTAVDYNMNKLSVGILERPGFDLPDFVRVELGSGLGLIDSGVLEYSLLTNGKVELDDADTVLQHNAYVNIYRCDDSQGNNEVLMLYIPILYYAFKPIFSMNSTTHNLLPVFGINGGPVTQTCNDLALVGHTCDLAVMTMGGVYVEAASADADGTVEKIAIDNWDQGGTGNTCQLIIGQSTVSDAYYLTTPPSVTCKNNASKVTFAIRNMCDVKIDGGTTFDLSWVGGLPVGSVVSIGAWQGAISNGNTLLTLTADLVSYPQYNAELRIDVDFGNAGCANDGTVTLQISSVDIDIFNEPLVVSQAY